MLAASMGDEIEWKICRPMFGLGMSYLDIAGRLPGNLRSWMFQTLHDLWRPSLIN